MSVKTRRIQPEAFGPALEGCVSRWRFSRACGVCAETTGYSHLYPPIQGSEAVKLVCRRCVGVQDTPKTFSGYPALYKVFCADTLHEALARRMMA